MSRIELHKGDITKLQVDAIVNAANKTLLGGGGVDGAIHRAAGSLLLEECRKLNGCETGEAKVTAGYQLTAGHVIHTVGPIWHGGENKEAQRLASCYLNSLKIASEQQFTTVAFPNISTGVYRFPKEKAASIAINEVNAFLKVNQSIQKAIFVCFDNENFSHYAKYIEEIG